MKCDELKSLKNLEVAFNTTSEQEQVIAEDSEGNCYGFDSWEEVYLKDEVDAAIDELKTENESLLQQNRELCLALQVMYSKEEYDKLKAEHHKERHEYIKMIAELKQKLEDAKATHYAESVDAGMRERKLKRALWLARAWGANQRTKYLDLFLTGRAHAIRKYKWIKITSKCRAKAEEYK